MGNIKIRNLDGSESIDVTSGNFLPMALSVDDGHERVTKKVTLQQVVSGGAVYADFSNQLKLSGNSVLTGFKVGDYSVISGDQFTVNFGGFNEGDDRDINLYQGGEQKLSIRDDITIIGSNNPNNDYIEIINPTTITEEFTVEDEVLTILGGETILKDRATFNSTGNFVDPSYITFGVSPETTLEDILDTASISSLSDIGDVSITNASANDILSFNGSNWVNEQPNEPSFFFSDKRLKDNIAVIPSALKKIESIRGVEFLWNSKADNKTNGKHDVGVIAQEVEKIVPSAVKEENDYLKVEYHKIIPLLIESVKELSKENENLKQSSLRFFRRSSMLFIALHVYLLLMYIILS